MAAKTKMKLGGLTMLTTLNMMGSGIILLPASLAGIGSISLFGWFVTAFGSIMLALCYAKMSRIIPKQGGMYVYSRVSLGNFGGFMETWCYWIAIWVGNVAVAVTAIGYMSYFFPVLSKPLPGALGSIAVIWFLIFLNYFGANFIGQLQKYSSLAILIPVGGMALFGWFFFHPAYITHGFNVTGHSDWRAFTAAVSLTLWAFLGFESACVAAGTVENPERNVPLATVIAVILSTILYVLSTLAIMGVVPQKELASSASPFSLAADMMFGHVAGTIVSICAVLACVASLNGWTFITGQISKAAADDGLFPLIFKKLNKFEVPILGIAIAGILETILEMGSISHSLVNQFTILTLLAVFVNIIPYITGISGLWVILRSARVPKKTYITFSIMGILGLIYTFIAFFGSGETSIYYGSFVVVLAIPLSAFAETRAVKNGKKVSLSD